MGLFKHVKLFFEKSFSRFATHNTGAANRSQLPLSTNSESALHRDSEAPIMTLNQRQPRPRVFPIVGDLFQTVPAFMAALREVEGAGIGSRAAVVAL